MASLSAYYPLPVVAGTTAGTYAEGNDSRIAGAAQKIGDSDIEITNAAKGIIFWDSGGTRRRLRVDTDGTVLTEVLP
jgi:hypothetical protein